jgi:hypothetical protein
MNAATAFLAQTVELALRPFTGESIMATQSRKSGIPEFFADTQSAESLRRKFIEAPMEAAGQSALGSAVELATLMSILPDAFVASQRRELERIKRSGNENDPRVAALQTSIEQAGVLQTMALRGQTRVQRALVAVASNDNVFHGFVSDADFAPLKGLTVRLTGTKTADAKAFSATTDADGYFSIDLGTKKSTPRDSGAKASPINMSQRIADLFAGLGQDTTAAPAGSPETSVGQVDILKNDKLLYHDPTFIALNEGSIYREYVIVDTEFSSAPDFRNFVSEASQAGTEVPPLRARAPKATKRSSRGAKTVRPKNEK